MKYWIYKDSRILGPFEKDAFGGLPGVDSSTLVSAGENAAAAEGDWRPAGDIAELSSLPLDRGPAWPVDDFSLSGSGVLDRLQIDAAGLLGDDEYPSAAEDLFQDADLKRTFGDLLTARPGPDEAELRRAKDRAAELTVQLEMLYKRVAELEAGQTSLLQRLAEKEILLRGQATAPANFLREPAAAPAPAPVLAPAPVAPIAAAPAAPPPPLFAAPAPLAVPSDWSTAVPGAGAFPSFGARPPEGAAPPAPPPVMFAPAQSAPEPALPPLPSDLTAPASGFSPPVPPQPVTLPGATAPVELTAPVVPPPPSEPKKSGFERKTFKIVPTVKAFRVVGAEEAGVGVPPPPPMPAMPEAPKSAAAPAGAAFDWGGAPPPGEPAMPVAKVAPKLEPPETIPPPPTVAPVPTPEAAAPAITPPVTAPPVTLSFGKPPVPEPAAAPAGFMNPGRNFMNPESMPTPAPMPRRASPGVEGEGDIAGAPSTQAALARLAKPAPEDEAEAPLPKRSNKGFLIGGGVLLVAMVVVVALFLRHPKDLKQMTELDDGRARVGAEPVDDQSKLPLVKPKMAAPPSDTAASPAEAPRAASQAKLDAAIAAVKEFPLDGDRGTVAELLQFSYSAAPGAGKESWNASETGPNTYLVEYRFAPSAPGAAEKHYLFEVDMDRGFVIGKNLDAQNMLAGGPRAEEPKIEKKPKQVASRKKKPAAAKKIARRPPEDLTPKEVPLLPLPNEGDLRPPAEDDGAFNSDTVNSGL